jgi:hypothetical protein
VRRKINSRLVVPSGTLQEKKRRGKTSILIYNGARNRGGRDSAASAVQKAKGKSQKGDAHENATASTHVGAGGSDGCVGAGIEVNGSVRSVPDVGACARR